MFEELFTTPEALEKHRTAPLAEQRLSYLDHLAHSGASRRTLHLTAMEQTRLAHLLDLKEGDTVSIPQKPASVECFVAGYPLRRPFADRKADTSAALTASQLIRPSTFLRKRCRMSAGPPASTRSGTPLPSTG